MAAMISLVQLAYTSNFDYASLYSKLDGAKYHVSNDTSNELAMMPLLGRLLHHESPEKLTSVVLLGCGTCAALPKLHALTQGHSYGMEVSANAVHIATALGRGTECKQPPCLRMGSLLDIPWEDRALDIAVSSDVLEHIHPMDVDRSIAEITRITKHILLLGIATGPSVRQGTELHLTRRNQAWWTKKFEDAGWISVEISAAIWKSLWNKPTSPRLWNYQGRICTDPNADVANNPKGCNCFFALARTQEDASALKAAASRLHP